MRAAYADRVTSVIAAMSSPEKSHQHRTDTQITLRRIHPSTSPLHLTKPCPTLKCSNDNLPLPLCMLDSSHDTVHHLPYAHTTNTPCLSPVRPSRH